MRWGMPTSKQALFKAATERADKLRAKGTEFDFAELMERVQRVIRTVAPPALVAHGQCVEQYGPADSDHTPDPTNNPSL